MTKNQATLNEYNNSLSNINYSLSKTAAAPIPDPIHMDTIPLFNPCLSISFNNVTVILAPVIPNGCPIAIAPPFTLTLSIVNPNFLTQYTACDANASFISNKSISLISYPVCFNTFGIANAGPIPITSGGTPDTANPINLPIIGNPNSFALLRFIINTAAAPSLTCDELPAVVVPPFLNTALNLPNDFIFVPALGPSSSITVIVLILPLFLSLI
mmetsp:Transcript_86937/g.106621  ORF Transcript_86937/g.106621 Transcript_86937/m.106621 type:complete len:214 (-) Transcript_86937:37-678(-)